MKKELLITFAILIFCLIIFLFFISPFKKSPYGDPSQGISLDSEIDNQTQFTDNNEGWTELNHPKFTISFPCLPTKEFSGGIVDFYNKENCITTNGRSDGYLFRYAYFDQASFQNLSQAEIYDQVQSSTVNEFKVLGITPESLESTEITISNVPAREIIYTFKKNSETVAYANVIVLVKEDRVYIAQSFYSTGDDSVEREVSSAVERAKFFKSFRLK